MIRLGDFEKFLFPMLDGQTLVTEIIKNFKDLINSNQIIVKDNGMQADTSKIDEIIQHQVSNSLKVIAKSGMLIG